MVTEYQERSGKSGVLMKVFT